MWWSTLSATGLLALAIPAILVDASTARAPASLGFSMGRSPNHLPCPVIPPMFTSMVLRSSGYRGTLSPPALPADVPPWIFALGPVQSPEGACLTLPATCVLTSPLTLTLVLRTICGVSVTGVFAVVLLLRCCERPTGCQQPYTGILAVGSIEGSSKAALAPKRFTVDMATVTWAAIAAAWAALGPELPWGPSTRGGTGAPGPGSRVCVPRW